MLVKTVYIIRVSSSNFNVQYFIFSLLEINSGNSPSDQRVCFSTNTDQYNVNNVTLKITTSTSQNGTFCTDIPLNETQGCVQTLSETVMYFNLKEIVNSSGEIQTNFTRDGKDPVTFRIIFGKTLCIVLCGYNVYIIMYT